MPVDDRASGEQATSVKANSGKKGGGFPPILVHLIVAVVMVALGYLVGSKMTAGGSGGETGTIAQDGSSAGHQDAEAPGEIILMEDIIVNPSGTGGTRFLSVSIGFEAASKETAELLQNREAVIKDALITILGSKTIEQLSDTKEKEITRFQIKKRTEQLLESEDLTAVYFTDFILQ